MEKGEEWKGKKRNICNKRRMEQAIQSNKEYYIAKGESDMKFIWNSDLNDPL
jgi:hypothetical protein